MTFEEFERLPECPEQLELLEGELISLPPAVLDHMDVVRLLFRHLDAAVAHLHQIQPAVALGTVYVETGYLLSSKPRSWLQPDLSLTHPNQTRGKYWEGAPAIVFEIVSEDDRPKNLLRKVRLYLAHGAAEVWMIYPMEREAHIYKPGTEAPIRETAKIHSDLLMEIEIPFDQFL
jgi:Uma2 family endonuclease